jgi:hypothetical protein
VQTVTYEFEFTPLPFETNISTLVFSEGKSLLPADANVPITSLLGGDAAEVPPAPIATEADVEEMRAYVGPTLCPQLVFGTPAVG